MLPLRPPRGLTLASATARITKLMEASARPTRQASSLRLPRVGALMRSRVDSSLDSGAFSISGLESPVLVPYSAKSLIFRPVAR
jgi:hypothetical protein